MFTLDTDEDPSWVTDLEAALQDDPVTDDDEKKNGPQSPQAILQQVMTTSPGTSLPSSISGYQPSVGQPYREIGSSANSKVFEQPGTPWAFKILLVDEALTLWDNYTLQMRVYASFDGVDKFVKTAVAVPRAVWFANKTSEFWRTDLELFPDDPRFPRQPRNVLCMERIPPLPQAVRDALVDLFCDRWSISAAKSDPSNADCLVHVLLGSKYDTAAHPGSYLFSLRNFKLHSDQIEQLRLDASALAATMADALALLHWQAKVDGMGVQFVLGSARPTKDHTSIPGHLHLPGLHRLSPGTSTFELVVNPSMHIPRTLSLWLLGFDTCQPISMSAIGVEQAITAFLKDPLYFPRPFSNNWFIDSLWTVFACRYIETAERFTSGTPAQSLPRSFIRGVQIRLLPK
ncbi:uncharacterized protein BO72DRAFT_279560 [Aspergillus fijiensis CBS 313.89]|uniref:DUF3669 domain-containing protein n=1 Tax=Aspergillus fijiensis CBS 313.89 TaxID=1448319 RepID=A0A8G1VTP4_9EURO|nr:uncharacterized protein BO72DRAFT_279560 [Aspergillus fijiensis CBS 313.89]RAK72302.1 hypothetical protein BO72DRAFT_279560 [Aspergillus fijiensis CBS 313.89]